MKMKYMHRLPYIFIAITLLAVLNIFCYKTAFGQAGPDVNAKPSISASATSETAFSGGAARETKPVELKKPSGKKKKLSLKTTIYIFDTIVSALMHLLIGTGAFMIVLMILKWFFLERRVEK